MQVIGGLTPVEAELLAARINTLDEALAVGFGPLNRLSLNIADFISSSCTACHHT